MVQVFLEGGPFMWVLLLIAIIVTVLTIKTSIQLSKEDKNKLKIENSINSILFWGGFALVLGFFAHFYGIYQAMLAIRRASDISPSIVAAGYAMSTITILSGLFILMASSIIWFVLKSKLNKLDF